MKILALNSSPRGDGESKTDGQQMFMDQKYEVEGDLSLLMQMDQLFGNN